VPPSCRALRTDREQHARTQRTGEPDLQSLDAVRYLIDDLPEGQRHSFELGRHTRYSSTLGQDPACRHCSLDARPCGRVTYCIAWAHGTDKPHPVPPLYRTLSHRQKRRHHASVPINTTTVGSIGSGNRTCRRLDQPHLAVRAAPDANH